jgi:hypothetical protein
MSMIQIHHLEAPFTAPLFAATRLGEGDLAAEVAQAFRAGALRHVADVHAATLEAAYCASQNLYETWIDTDGVVRRSRATTARSTMIGDVLVQDGKAFVVAAQGFLPLPI